MERRSDSRTERDAAQVHEGRRHDDVGVLERVVLQQDAELLDEVDRLDVVEVHLPVADDEGAQLI